MKDQMAFPVASLCNRVPSTVLVHAGHSNANMATNVFHLFIAVTLSCRSPRQNKCQTRLNGSMPTVRLLPPFCALASAGNAIYVPRFAADSWAWHRHSAMLSKGVYWRGITVKGETGRSCKYYTGIIRRRLFIRDRHAMRFSNEEARASAGVSQSPILRFQQRRSPRFTPRDRLYLRNCLLPLRSLALRLRRIAQIDEQSGLPTYFLRRFLNLR